MAGIQQEPGFDTSVETFTPFRSSPVYRRVVRKYHCQENLNGTEEFKQMTFNIHQPDQSLVIGECRLVLPLAVSAVDMNGHHMNMSVNLGNAACNIAVSENPFSAFRVIDTAINGKVYTESPQAFGNMLSKCYSSVSEMSFQNNHSLKCIANTNRQNSFDEYRRLPLFNPDGVEQRHYVEEFSLKVDGSAFVAEQLNSGFLERSRQFQTGLVEEGVRWQGEISSLLNTALWSSEARGQSNVQIPYVEDLFCRFVFGTNACMLDRQFAPQVPGYVRRMVAQGLFEFLTPLNEATYQQQTIPRKLYPTSYWIRWTGDPYLQVEYIQFQEMLPIYRLRGFRYQHIKSPEFVMPMPQRRDAITYQPINVMQECLAVPNKVYCWGELSDSAKTAFCWGGTFRTCDLKNINVRVNGHAHIIQDPDAQSMQYKWFKRLTNSTHEWPVYSQQKVFVFSPTEIGLNSWLENDAILSTLDISAEVGLSKLQQVEYSRVDNNDAMHQAGYTRTYLNWDAAKVYNANNYNYPTTIKHSQELERDTRWPRGDKQKIALLIETERQDRATVGHWDVHTPVPSLKEEADAWLHGIKIRNEDDAHPEIVSVRGVERCLVQIRNAVWTRIDVGTGLPIEDNFYLVQESDYFELNSAAPKEAHGFKFMPWAVWVFDKDAQHQYSLNAAHGWDATSIQDYIVTARCYSDANFTEPLFDFNGVNPILHGSHKRCGPSHEAFSITNGNLVTGGVDYEVGPKALGSTEYPGNTNGDQTVWVCMGVSDNQIDEQYVTSHWRLGGAGSTGGWTPFVPTQVRSHVVCNVQRGIMGTPSERYDARGETYESHGIVQPDVSPQLKYELNVLLEYSNSQILMSKTRDIPIEVSNLVPVSSGVN